VGAQASARGLEASLSSRRWLRRSRPFAHIVGNDVFTAEVYDEMVAAFRGLLRPADGSPGRFARTMPGYDALGMLFRPDLDGPFALFVSRAWRDLLAGVVGVDVTEHVSGALHHHPVGSADGELHTDLNPGWFVDVEPRADGMVVADHTACRYGDGQPRRPGVRPRELIRAVAVIYYLANPRWVRGAGGVTGLYAAANDPVRSPAAAVPPVNNSILVFECTPWSLHSFLRNRTQRRNCVAMFLHQRREDVAARWGEEAITKR
jgi:hypothetical protein